MIKQDDPSRCVDNPQLSFEFVCRRLVGTDYTLKGLVCGGTVTKSRDYDIGQTSYGLALHIKSYPVYECTSCEAVYSINYSTGSLTEGHSGNEKILDNVANLVQNTLYDVVFNTMSRVRTLEEVDHVSVEFLAKRGDYLHIHYKGGAIVPYEFGRT